MVNAAPSLMKIIDCPNSWYSVGGKCPFLQKCPNNQFKMINII